MRYAVLIESAMAGLLYVNGQFCGPMEREGQVFPAGRNTEMYIQLFPFGEGRALTAALEMREGRIVRLDPENGAFALVWPDGVIQLELCMQGQTELPAQDEAARGTLLQYLNMKLAGDAQTAQMWLGGRELPLDLSAYQGVVPLRFAPLQAPQRFDDRAGLVRRIAPNAAVIDAALAITVPAGQGRRLIESVHILPT